jgi:foldase protein PrsA
VSPLAVIGNRPAAPASGPSALHSSVQEETVPRVGQLGATIAPRVSRYARLPSALGAFFVLAVLVAACGSGVPGNSVARVDDSLIKKSTFDHWLNIAARSSQPPGSGATVTVPDPPNFTRCVANLRKSAPKPAKGQPRQTDTQFKAQCKQEYEGLRDQVLQVLIQGKWLEGEASDQGVKVSDAEIQREFNREKKQSFPKESQYRQFLKTSGFTEADLKFRVKTTLLANKIRQKVTKGTTTVTDQQISSYYAKNRSRFSQPQRRDLQVVLTKTRAKAVQAKSAIQGGQSFGAVAKKFSIDQASKTQGGKLPGVVRGQQEKALDAAVFTTPKGTLRGPVKTQFGYYVFRVTKITAATQQSLTQARASIRALLISQRQQKALTTFSKKFQKKWKARTNCRKGFVVDLCKNAPKPKKGQPQAPPGAIPQSGSPSGAPPPGGTPQPGGAGQP